MANMDFLTVMRKMTEIKKGKSDYYDSNIYAGLNNIELFEEAEGTLAFASRDRDVLRVYFASNNAETLGAVLQKFPSAAGIEIVGTSINETTKSVLLSSGFQEKYVYLRGMNRNLIESLHSGIPDKFSGIDLKEYVQQASLDDAEDIYDYIHDVFDELADHLQTIEEVKEDINNGYYLVNKTEGHLNTIVKSVIQGKKVYMEYAANRGPSVLAHSLYLSALEEAVSMGINVAYNWMRDDNYRSLAFCSRFGIVPDGMKNFVFQKE